MRIYDSKPYCDDSITWSDLICQTRREGYFYEVMDAFSTWAKTTNVIYAGGATQETDAILLPLMYVYVCVYVLPRYLPYSFLAGVGLLFSCLAVFIM